MGRTHTPTAILDAKGSFLKHPERARPAEPTSDRPLGAPPKYLTANQKKIWKEVAKRVLPGVALESDRDAFEMMIRLTDDMRSESADRPFTTAQRNTLISLWSRFALTPADRSKVVVDKPKESALGAFLSRKKTSRPVEEKEEPEPSNTIH